MFDFLGPMFGQQMSAFTVPVGFGGKKWARERAFTQGQVGKILDGAISETLVDETKVEGSTGLLNNVTALDASGAGGSWPVITVCNEVAGIADDAEGHWAPGGVCKALVEADDTTIVVGRVLRLDLSTPEHCFVLDESGARSVGYGYVLQPQAVSVAGTKYLLWVWFSPIPIIGGTAS